MAPIEKSEIWNYFHNNIDDGFATCKTCHNKLRNNRISNLKTFQEEQLHYGNFYAQWLKCTLCTDKIVKEATQALSKSIGTLILQSMEKRIKILFENKSLIGCLYLDPRFQHKLTALQKIDAINYLKSIWDRILEMNSSSPSCSTSNSNIEKLGNHFFDEEEEMLNEYLEEDVHERVNSTTDVYAKIENLKFPFHRSDTDVLAFWKAKKSSDAELYAISNVCFAVPPTQVTVERAFSTLRLVLTDYRNRLSHEVLENILLVKLNRNFLEAAIETLPLFEDEDDLEE